MYVRPRIAAATAPPPAAPSLLHAAAHVAAAPPPRSPLLAIAAPTSQSEGGAVYNKKGSATFNSTLPANTFSGNNADSGPNNCFNKYGTIVGTCG